MGQVILELTWGLNNSSYYYQLLQLVQKLPLISYHIHSESVIAPPFSSLGIGFCSILYEISHNQMWSSFPVSAIIHRTIELMEALITKLD